MKLHLLPGTGHVCICCIALLSILFVCTIPACQNGPECDQNYYVSVAAGTNGALSATATVSGGNQPFFYHWSSGGEDATEYFSASGTYSVTVTDALGCETGGNVIVYDSASLCGSAVSDADGNSYDVVSIGSQCWLTANLNNTAGIAETSDSAQWINAGINHIPAWCYYNNQDNGKGKLYNWHAVHTGNLCPAGWHIPTAADWQTLFTTLGGDTVAGGKMKNTVGWNPPNTGATNSSGFFADPEGGRGDQGYFYGAGMNGNFWSSSPSIDTNFVQYIILDTYEEGAYVTQDLRGSGYSCRCVKD